MCQDFYRDCRDKSRLSRQIEIFEIFEVNQDYVQINRDFVEINRDFYSLDRDLIISRDFILNFFGPLRYLKFFTHLLVILNYQNSFNLKVIRNQLRL